MTQSIYTLVGSSNESYLRFFHSNQKWDDPDDNGVWYWDYDTNDWAYYDHENDRNETPIEPPPDQNSALFGERNYWGSQIPKEESTDVNDVFGTDVSYEANVQCVFLLTLPHNDCQNTKSRQKFTRYMVNRATATAL